MTTTAFELANLIPAAPPILGDTIVVASVGPPLDTNWTAMTSGGAFVPAATAQGQGLVSGPGPGFAWSIGVSGIPEPPVGAVVYGRGSGTWTPVVPVSGTTMTGPLYLYADPTASNQAATKNYVDQPIDCGTF